MHLPGDIVLLVTHSGDYFTIDRVEEAVLKLGAQPFRLDTDRFPMSVELQSGKSHLEQIDRIKYGDRSISAEEVRAVWMRRIWHPQLSQDLAPQFQSACARESLAALDGFWDSLRSARWVDDLQRIQFAENKLRQMRVAQEVGFVVPQTLVTNDPEQAREFFSQVQGNMVAKLLTPLSISMEGSPFFFYTSPVKEEDLQDASSLRYCPMVFQEEIPKDKELRVVYVDGQLFVGALDASVYGKSTLDWRRSTGDVCAWQTHEMPLEIRERLQAFMGKLGLMFGALDFILTPSGEYVFLEVNPTGEWGMLERDLDYPISVAIAKALLAA